MNWTTIQDALLTWAGNASGLTTDKVWWSVQSKDAQNARPQKPFIQLRIIGRRSVGQDWVDTANAAIPSAGAELEYKARGNRIITVQFTAFTESESSADAMDLLETIQSKVKLPSHADALRTAGIGILDFEPTQGLDAVINTVASESRAIMNVRCALASEVSETGTYIEFVETECTISA
jgi:hypothetical protein